MRWLWLVVAVTATACIAVTPTGKRIGIAPAAPMNNLWNRRNDDVAPFEPLAPPTGNPFVEPDDPAKPKPPVSPQEEIVVRTMAALLGSLAQGQLPLLSIFAVW